MNFEIRSGSRARWRGVEATDIFRDVYNRDHPEESQIRVDESEPWTAHLWADVLRNPYPKRVRDPGDYSIRINPDEWKEFQDRCFLDVSRRYNRSGVTVRQEVPCTTWLGFGPRLDIAVFDRGTCFECFECRHVYELRTGEALQAITCKALLQIDVTMVVPTKSKISRTADSLLTSAGIPLERLDFPK